MADFTLEIVRLHWIGDAPGDAFDLCLHGDVRIEIGAETIRGACTVSTASLLLMRAAFDAYAINDTLRLLPCCAHTMYDAGDGAHVEIIGCPYGLDFGVRHAPDVVLLTTRGGTQLALPAADYRAQVMVFADAVREFYDASAPKKVPEDPHERAGYAAFWREWHALRARL